MDARPDGRMEDWDEWVVEFLRASADLDLRVDGFAVPRFVAAQGDRPLFLAEVRPFARGGYHQPLIELMALAVPLDADRIAVGMTGRLWSLNDPIPPVVEGAGDLRQQALVLELIDGHEQPAEARSVLMPFSLHGDDVVWEKAFDPGPAHGWIPSALSIMVDHRAELHLDREDIRDQAERCLALGHTLGLEEAVAHHLGIEATPVG